MSAHSSNFGSLGSKQHCAHNTTKTLVETPLEIFEIPNEEPDKYRDFPGGTVVKNPPANAGNTGLSPGPGRSHMPRSN